MRKLTNQGFSHFHSLTGQPLTLIQTSNDFPHLTNECSKLPASQAPIKRKAKLTWFSSCIAVFFKKRNDNPTSAIYSKNKFLKGDRISFPGYHRFDLTLTSSTALFIKIKIAFLMTLRPWVGRSPR